MKKFIVLLLLLLTAKPFFLFSDLPLAIGLDYSNFNKQNQLMGTISIHSPLNTLSNADVLDIALGFRTFNNKIPAFVYNFALCKVDIFEPFVRGGVYCDFAENGDAALGPHEQTLGNYLFGITFLNFDKSQIVNSLTQWAQIRYGLGISTYGHTYNDSGYFNFEGFIATKLGYSTINFGNINFENFKDNNKDFKSLESGLKINMDVSYKRILYLITNLDYTFYLSDKMINELSFGLDLDFFKDIPNPNSKYENFGLFKFSIGTSYNKYYFGSNYIEFLKIDMGVKYFFRI